jgi:aspartyl/asparaginyl beta-hydroxylase (cupin superfamily)
MTVEEIWYAYKGKKYAGSFPPFYQNDAFDWTQKIHDNFAVINREIDAYIKEQSGSFEPYFNTTLVNQFKSWKVSNFIFWTKRINENCAKIPQTMKLVESIPGLTTLGISILEPGGHIKPHHGDTNAIIRCHLGLRVPASAPDCALRVKNEIQGWENGRLMLFCDAWEHEAWNKTHEARYVLIFDVIHPDYLGQKKKICANVRSWLDLQKLYERKPHLRNAKRRVKIFLRQYLRLKYMFG